MQITQPVDLKVSQLCFGFAADENAEPLLDNVSLTLSAGERLQLTGANGTGKTTLLRLILGFLTPWSGTISWQGQKLTNPVDFVMLRRQVGMLFQNVDDMLFCPTVKDDILFGLRNLLSYDNKIIDESYCHAQVGEIMAELEIEHLADVTPFRLSGGEKRRVGLAAVLIMQPKLLLLDEPTAGLDSTATKNLLTILNSRRENGMGQLIVSHDHEFLQACGGNLLMLQIKSPR